MHRTIALLALLLASLFAAGCDDGTDIGSPDDEQDVQSRGWIWADIGEDEDRLVWYDDDGLIWYDDELDACFKQPDGGGKAYKVPCPDEA
jgi:hypothetical protein